MPLGYHISADQGLITVQGQGVVSLGELTSLGRSMLSDAAYDPELPQLLDFRGLRPSEGGNLEDLQAFVLGPYRDRTQGSVAVVIDDHLESEHCADIFLLTCAIHEAELFADYDLAVKWLIRQAFAPRLAMSAEEEYAGGEDADRSPE